MRRKTVTATITLVLALTLALSAPAYASVMGDYLTGYSEQEEYNELLVAPLTLRDMFVGLIQEQAERAREGQPARIAC